jgi:hypothetical protein
MAALAAAQLRDAITVLLSELKDTEAALDLALRWCLLTSSMPPLGA